MSGVYKEITKEEIRSLNLANYQGKIAIVDQKEAAIKALDALHSESLLGFDTERKPSFKKGKLNPISLVQIASGSKVYLFRTHLFNIPGAFIRLLENENINKVGVGLEDDLKGLKKYFQFTGRGFTDLSSFFQASNYQQSSLKYLAAMVLNVRISKNQQVSNWERKELTTSQIKYAATDGWIPREIYIRMKKDGYEPQI